TDLAKGYYSLARIYATVERLSDAESSLTRAIGLFEELIKEQPDDLDTQKRLGTCYRLLGDWVGGLDGNQRLDERRRWYHRAIDRLKPLAEQNPEVVEYQNEWAATLVNLFDAESRADNSAGARDALERAREIYDRLIRRDPDAPRPKRDLAVTLRELAI